MQYLTAFSYVLIFSSGILLWGKEVLLPPTEWKNNVQVWCRARWEPHRGCIHTTPVMCLPDWAPHRAPHFLGRSTIHISASAILCPSEDYMRYMINSGNFVQDTVAPSKGWAGASSHLYSGILLNQASLDSNIYTNSCVKSKLLNHLILPSWKLCNRAWIWKQASLSLCGLYFLLSCFSLRNVKQNRKSGEDGERKKNEREKQNKQRKQISNYLTSREYYLKNSKRWITIKPWKKIMPVSQFFITATVGLRKKWERKLYPAHTESL